MLMPPKQLQFYRNSLSSSGAQRHRKVGYNAGKRFQFRLRTLFIVVTVAAVGCAWLGHECRIMQERRAMRAWIEKNGGVCTIDALSPDSQAEEQSLVPRWLGGQRVDDVLLIPPAADVVVERVKAALSGTVVRNLQW